jgi:hypothetical protein
MFTSFSIINQLNSRQWRHLQWNDLLRPQMKENVKNVSSTNVNTVIHIHCDGKWVYDCYFAFQFKQVFWKADQSMPQDCLAFCYLQEAVIQLSKSKD